MKSSPIIRKAQAGFTLIELIVVIVILGILAATALPRMFDMSGQARLAKMQGALGAVRAASASAHAQWLVNGGQLACTTGCGANGADQPGTAVIGEGQTIVMVGGYPDVGGTGQTATAASTPALIAASGILMASGLTEPDYVISAVDPAAVGATPPATANFITVSADAAHPACRFSYREATQTAGAANVQPVLIDAPQFIVGQLLLANCS